LFHAIKVCSRGRRFPAEVAVFMRVNLRVPSGLFTLAILALAVPLRCAASLRLAVKVPFQNSAVYDRTVRDPDKKQSLLPASRRLAAHRSGRARAKVHKVAEP